MGLIKVVHRLWGESELLHLRYFPSLNALSIQSMVVRFPSVFSISLGCYKNKTFELVLKSDSKPIFYRPRVIQFSFKDKVSLGLDRLIVEGLLEQEHSSEWPTPIVPVVKVDGSIRDYKVTVNNNLVRLG